MATQHDLDSRGAFDRRYAAFLETVTHLRAKLHRYCARMTGSALDGEDVMQEALFEAYRKLDMYDESRALSPWLFQIAHNRCIDFLRSRAARAEAEATSAFAGSDVVAPVDPAGPTSTRALERLVINLPPKERACVLLKDIFDHSLEEIAELVDSTTGGVKAALNRGRAKLAKLEDAPTPSATIDGKMSALLSLYVERFNRQDWDGVRELTSADARLRVADCFAGRLSDSRYFQEYERTQVPWRMELACLDGEAALIVLHDLGVGFVPVGAVRLEVVGEKIVRIADFYNCPWILETAAMAPVAAP